MALVVGTKIERADPPFRALPGTIPFKGVLFVLGK